MPFVRSPQWGRSAGSDCGKERSIVTDRQSGILAYSHNGRRSASIHRLQIAVSASPNLIVRAVERVRGNGLCLLYPLAWRAIGVAIGVPYIYPGAIAAAFDLTPQSVEDGCRTVIMTVPQWPLELLVCCTLSIANNNNNNNNNNSNSNCSFVYKSFSNALTTRFSTGAVHSKAWQLKFCSLSCTLRIDCLKSCQQTHGVSEGRMR